MRNPFKRRPRGQPTPRPPAIVDRYGPQKHPMMRVTEITAGSDGAYLVVIFPVSYDAFHDILRSLEKRGINPPFYTGSGSVGVWECTFKLGPFSDAKEACRILATLLAEVKRVYETERSIVDRFAHLKRDYPINGSGS